MAKRLSQKEHSRLVTDAVSSAEEQLSHLTLEEKLQACDEYIERQRMLDSQPALIKHIRKYGVIDAIRGYTDEDVKAWAKAKELVDRELRAPGDFVSKRSFAAGQANANGKSEAYDRDEIRQEARRIGYFDLKKGKHGRKAKRMQIVSNLNMRKQNPSTSDDSWNRLLSRILDHP